MNLHNGFIQIQNIKCQKFLFNKSVRLDVAAEGGRKGTFYF